MKRLLVSLLALGSFGCSSESVPEASELPSVSLGVATQSLTSSVKAVPSFGSNPGGLKLFEYVPAPLPANAPLVLVLHGCTQGSTEAQAWGWNELADKHGFVVGYPEQTTQNNSVRCFNWGGEYGDMTNLQRNKGENASIKQMVDTLVSNHKLDAKRVFIVGFSAGGAEAILAAATWPDVFAGAASLSGIPYGCPTSYSEVFTCQNPGVDKPAADWGNKVKSAFAGFTGKYPRVSIWQGSADTTVGTKNRTALVRQWTNVHGASETPSATSTVDGAKYETFTNGNGEVVVESYEVPGMNHGVAIAPSKQCGTAGMFAFDKGICSTSRVADFFGLTGAGPAPVTDAGTTLPDGGTKPGTPGPSGSPGNGNGAANGKPGAPGAAPGASGAQVIEGEPRSAGSTCSAAPGPVNGTLGGLLGLATAVALWVSRRRNEVL